MLLVHSKCGKEVKLNIAKSLIVLASLSCNRKTALISRLEISKKESIITNPEFFCLYCGHNVDISEVHSVCMACNESVKLDFNSIPLDSNGVYCPKCFSRRFGDEKSISILEVLKTITIK